MKKLQSLCCLAIVSLLAGLPVSLPALDPHQPIDELYHTSWTARDGLSGSVSALAQTKDGYLWVGTSDGLYRFDGIEFEPYQPEAGSFSAGSVSALLALPDGGLWIGYARGGASFLQDGRVTHYSERDGFPLALVRRFVQDGDGYVWAAVVGGFARFDGHRWQKVGMNWNYSGKSPEALFVDRWGTLWVATRDVILYLPRGKKRFLDAGVYPDFRIVAFGQLADGSICVFDDTHNRIRRLPSELEVHNARPQTESASNHILVDRDGSIWVTFEVAGLLRIPYPRFTENIDVARAGPGVELFTEKQGLTGLPQTALEDREGDVWIGTDGGLDRFRHRNLTWQPLPGDSYSLVAGENGDIWVGNGDGLTFRLQQHRPIRNGPRDVWMDYRAPDGTLWFSSPGILWKWWHGRFYQQTAPKEVTQRLISSGNKDPMIITSITSDHSGGLWAAIAGFGEFELQDNVWKFVDVLKDHPDWAARSAYTDARGRVWLVYGEVVAVVDHGRVRTYSARDGLALGHPNIVGGGLDQTYVGGESGIAVLKTDRFYPMVGLDGSNFGLITGIIATAHHGLWLAAGPGIVHIPQHELQEFLQNTNHRVSYEVFDLMSDLPEPLQGGVGYSAGAIQDNEGFLWFATRRGVARVDPAHILRNPLPPPVSIRSVVADGRTYPVHGRVSLPPLTRDLEIDYTALSLPLPERVRFRYRLEGEDRDWRNVGKRRQAFYRDLAPGNYRFHVIACNNDGVWNETGTTLFFNVEPAWYQTLWFRILCLVLASGLIYSIYLFRLRQQSAAMKERYEERLEERTRLARELHDTLLQTIQGSKLAVDTAVADMRDVDAAQSVLNRLSGWLERAVAEGRAVLDSLRNTIADGSDLMTAFRRTFDDYAVRSDMKLFTVSAGQSREMDVFARDEVYRIGDEAIRNACLHAEARALTVELAYQSQSLLLRIRDDGRGMDSHTIAYGRKGHFGLIGMKERAERLGAHLTITSSSCGTEITLQTPGKIIYRKRGLSWAGRIGRLVERLKK